jgi:hypothetical protein
LADCHDFRGSIALAGQLTAIAVALFGRTENS